MKLLTFQSQSKKKFLCTNITYAIKFTVIIIGVSIDNPVEHTNDLYVLFDIAKRINFFTVLGCDKGIKKEYIQNVENCMIYVLPQKFKFQKSLQTTV